MWWVKNTAGLLAILVATLLRGGAIAAEAESMSTGKILIQREQEEMREKEARERKVKSLERCSQLAKEHSGRPHNPQIIELYLASMEADINGDFEKQMALLSEVYRLSLTEQKSSLWVVLQHDYVDIPSRLYHLVDRLAGYSYEEKLVKYDHFSRYQPTDERVQSHLVGVMLERMSYDAVLEYCARRIAEGHDVYRILRVELRLLMQQESIQHELIDQYKEEARRTLALKQPGGKEITEARIYDEASQRYVRHYDPTTVVPKHVNIMFDEVRSDPTRDVARLKRYCNLLRVSYEMTHANKEAILSYYAYAAGVISASDAEFSPFRTSQEIETERNEALAHIRTCEAEVEKRFEDYGRDRDAGKFGETYKYKPVVFDFNLYKRWERDEALKQKGEEVSYLGLDDVFPR